MLIKENKIQIINQSKFLVSLMKGNFKAYMYISTHG